MHADLMRQIRQAGFRLDGEGFTVKLPAGRMQHVYVSERADGSVWLSSVVAASSVASAVPGGELVLLLQNRHMDLVEFNVDRKGRWIAQTGCRPDPCRMPRSANTSEHCRRRRTVEQLVCGKDVN